MSGSDQNEIEVFRTVVGLFEENVFFLRRADRAETVIVDPGAEGERLSSLIESKGWKPVAIVNTHAHLDHIGAVEFLKGLYRIPFFLHPEDESLLRAAPENARAYGIPAPAVPAVDRPMTDGETLDLAGLDLKILHTPGHTPGGICVTAGYRVFAGDTLFSGSIGRTDLPGGETESLLRSIREKLLTLPDDRIVHCGHGPDTTIGRERKSNPFLGPSEM